MAAQNLKEHAVHVDDVGRRRQVVENDLNSCGVLGNVENRDLVGATRAFGVQKGRLRLVPRPATTINVLQRQRECDKCCEQR